MPTLVPSPPRDASPTRRGLMGVGAQVFAGLKSFLAPIRLAIFPTAEIPAGEEGLFAYDSTRKRAVLHTDTGWVPMVVDVGGTDPTNLAEHLADSSGAHPASAVSNTPTGSISATDVQGAINELATDLQDHVADATGAHGASAISVAPVGRVVATDVQAALEDLANDDGWVDIPYDSGWEDPAGNTIRPQYRIDTAGRCWLRGTFIRDGGPGPVPGPLGSLDPQGPPGPRRVEVPVVFYTGSSRAVGVLTVHSQNDGVPGQLHLDILSNPQVESVTVDGVVFYLI